MIEKIKQLESEGKFDVDVEQDPPTKPLLPNMVDYTQKKLMSKIKSRVAFSVARKFLNKIIAEKQLIIKEVKGIENLKNLETGAIITCNHFNAFDSFAMHVVYEMAEQKKRKFFRVIREGNYTNFPGFYGFLMRNCNTLPLSSNKETMKMFMRSVDQLLKDGHFILVYPEQSMWWNYRKPRPFKDGAFRFACKNNRQHNKHKQSRTAPEYLPRTVRRILQCRDRQSDTSCTRRVLQIRCRGAGTTRTRRDSKQMITDKI